MGALLLVVMVSLTDVSKLSRFFQMSVTTIELGYNVTKDSEYFVSL
jgi:hypothetical protein